MSTTTKREVALSYAAPQAGKPATAAGVVFEIQLGLFNRGADSGCPRFAPTPLQGRMKLHTAAGGTFESAQ